MTDLGIDPQSILPSSGISIDALASPPRRARKEAGIRLIFLLAALVSIVISLLIVLSLVREASVFALEVDWGLTWGEIGWFPRQGIFDMPTILVSSLIVTGVAMMVAGPAGAWFSGVPLRVREPAYPSLPQACP